MLYQWFIIMFRKSKTLDVNNFRSLGVFCTVCKQYELFFVAIKNLKEMLFYCINIVSHITNISWYSCTMEKSEQDVSELRLTICQMSDILGFLDGLSEMMQFVFISGARLLSFKVILLAQLFLNLTALFFCKNTEPIKNSLL